jgi:MoaA/NifB/PqqE/SkfB family radical SAM enzyme
VSLEKVTRARERKEPLVSVLVAAYRRPETIARAIESALAQRSTPLEVIVVVDGCPETAKAARAFAASPEVVLVESAVNLGVGRSRNRALELARGELCLHLDADDALAPGALETIVAAFAGKPHVGAVYGDLELADGSGARRGDRREPDFPGRRAFLEAPFDVPLVAYRRSVGRAAGGLDEGAMRCDNASLLARIARTHAVRRLPRVLLRHQVDGKNLSLAYRPADCASCASATSCRLAAARGTVLARESHRLKKLSLVLTTRCNLDCSYCYTRRYKWDLTTEDCLRLLVQARDQGATTVAFTGGEPSLHEGFETVIASAADLGFEVLVISNGWNWPDERIALFTSLPRARLAVSLEGRTAATHDAIRGPGSHATLMKFMERVRARAPGFPISAIVVSKEDGTGELEDIARWAMDDLRLEALRVDRVAPSGNAEANEEFSPEATRRYLEAARAIAARYPGRVESLTESFPAAGCPLYVNFQDDTFPDLQVFADGTVPMCVYLHLDRPTRLGMASLDVEELLEKRNCARAKTLIDEPFKDRARQIERKGLFTCVECLERRNALDRERRWPPASGAALPLLPAAPPRALAGRPRSAAERWGLAPRAVVLG